MKITRTSYIGHCRTKIEVMVQLRNFSLLTTIQTLRSHKTTLVQDRKLILSMYVHLILIYKIDDVVRLE